MTRRIVAAAPATLTVALPGVPDGPVTVDVVSHDGTVLVDDRTATVVDTDGTVQLTAADVPDVDVLTVTWSGTYDGVPDQVTQRVSAVGGLIVDRELVAARVAAATAVDIARVADAVESIVTVATGWRWVRELVVEQHRPSRQMRVRLEARPVRELVSVTDVADTSAVTARIENPSLGLLAVAHRRLVDVVARVGADDVPIGLASAATEATRIGVLELGKPGGNRRGRQDYGDEARAFPFFNTSLKHGRPFGIDGVDSDVMAFDRRPVGV